MPEVGGGVRLGSMPSGISRGVDGGAHGPKDQLLRGSWSSKLVLKVGPRRKSWSSPADNKKKATGSAISIFGEKQKLDVGETVRGSSESSRSCFGRRRTKVTHSKYLVEELEMPAKFKILEVLERQATRLHPYFGPFP